MLQGSCTAANPAPTSLRHTHTIRGREGCGSKGAPEPGLSPLPPAVPCFPALRVLEAVQDRWAHGLGEFPAHTPALWEAEGGLGRDRAAGALEQRAQ